MKNRDLNYTDHWRTPPQYLHEKNKEFNFDFDPCPWHHNLEEWDGLERDWGQMNFVNPPYSDLKSTGSLKTSFVKKGIIEFHKKRNSLFLLPVSTSTVLFHHIILPEKPKIIYIEKRLPFIGINDKGQKINFHLIEETTDETFIYKWIDDAGQEREKELKRYIKNSGQHDSFEILFYKRRLWKI